MAFQISYYNHRVLREIEDWPVDLLADYARLTALLAAHGPALGMPHSKAFGSGLFELRAHAKSGIGRGFYCYLEGKKIVVLHAFVKKTQQTPDRELEIARKRLREVKHG